MAFVNPARELALRKAIVVLTTGKRNKSPLTAEEVIAVAKKFEAYVLNCNEIESVLTPEQGKIMGVCG